MAAASTVQAAPAVGAGAGATPSTGATSGSVGPQQQLQQPQQPVFSVMIMSDLHLEFPGTSAALPAFAAKARNLALLGDIGYPGSAAYRAFLLAQAQRFERVFVVAGNHERYKTTTAQCLRDLRSACAQHPNLVLLERHGVDVPVSGAPTTPAGGPTSVRVIGATLWESIAPSRTQAATASMSDFELCYVDERDAAAADPLAGDAGPPADAKAAASAAAAPPGGPAAPAAAGAGASAAAGPATKPTQTTPTPPAAPAAAVPDPSSKLYATGPVLHPVAGQHRRLTPADTNAMHARDLAFFEAELAKARAATPPQPVVVFSHHPPGWSARARALYGAGLPVWAYGHTHHSDNELCPNPNQTTLKGGGRAPTTRVLSNQCGYVTMGGLATSGFVPECVVDVFGDGTSRVTYSDSVRVAERARQQQESEAYAASLAPPPDAPPL